MRNETFSVSQLGILTSPRNFLLIYLLLYLMNLKESAKQFYSFLHAKKFIVVNNSKP